MCTYGDAGLPAGRAPLWAWQGEGWQEGVGRDQAPRCPTSACSTSPLRRTSPITGGKYSLELHSSVNGTCLKYHHIVDYSRNWVCRSLMTTHLIGLELKRIFSHISISWNAIRWALKSFMTLIDNDSPVLLCVWRVNRIAALVISLPAQVKGPNHPWSDIVTCLTDRRVTGRPLTVALRCCWHSELRAGLQSWTIH